MGQVHPRSRKKISRIGIGMPRSQSKIQPTLPLFHGRGSMGFMPVIRRRGAVCAYQVLRLVVPQALKKGRDQKGTLQSPRNRDDHRSHPLRFRLNCRGSCSPPTTKQSHSLRPTALL